MTEIPNTPQQREEHMKDARKVRRARGTSLPKDKDSHPDSLKSRKVEPKQPRNDTVIEEEEDNDKDQKQKELQDQDHYSSFF